MTGIDGPVIRVHPGAGLVEARFRGAVDLAALVATSRSISAHPRFSRGMHTLADFSNAALLLDYADMDRFRDYLHSIEALRGDCRWAAIATRSPSRASVSLFAAMAEAFELRIRVRHFYSEDEARGWLAA